MERFVVVFCWGCLPPAGDDALQTFETFEEAWDAMSGLEVRPDGDIAFILKVTERGAEVKAEWVEDGEED